MEDVHLLETDLSDVSQTFVLLGEALSGWLLTYGEAIDEWIAGMLSGTPANRIVISHDAQCVRAARVLAGIAASCVHAGLALLAISAN